MISSENTKGDKMKNYVVTKSFGVQGKDGIRTYDVGEVLECIGFNLKFGTFRDKDGFELSLYSVPLHNCMKRVDDNE